MKKRIVLVLLAIFLLIVDNSFAPFISIKGAWPSFLFIFAIAYSIINGPKEGMIIGIIAGLLQDIFFYDGFGVNTLINMIFCFTAGNIGEDIWREKSLIPTITVFIMTILKYLVVFIIFYLLKIHIDFFRGVITAFYNAIIMLVIYKVIFKFFNREDIRRTWRF
ncbi:rod shape-determining protein MreD [Clostridium vincentii]|uniref:Rod shape-determining protein MreD n=1 Tax=Clostridium vincentii TaxID=52704 RepID=A0A2T0BF33_9CLOT|nr:rod shape-determining protein MreD [Clostridium vincentii]PRR82442.1 rod shape-determining protein MreD [Clostridium vincentii]